MELDGPPSGPLVQWLIVAGSVDRDNPCLAEDCRFWFFRSLLSPPALELSFPRLFSCDLGFRLNLSLRHDRAVLYSICDIPLFER